MNAVTRARLPRSGVLLAVAALVLLMVPLQPGTASAHNRDPGKDFDALSAAGNNEPWGIWGAGVTNSVLPRFLLDDPTEAGWTPQPKTNNGGLRWLKQKLAELGL